jgi:steroid 5-alpha reductase family enzyme
MDMSLNQIMVLCACTIFVYMTLIYLLSMRIKNASIVDIGWGLGFVLVAMVLLLSAGKPNPAAAVVYSLVNMAYLLKVRSMQIGSTPIKMLSNANPNWRYF